jgi:hypothetical protein
MSTARNTKMSDIPNATRAIAANPQLKALTAGSGRGTRANLSAEAAQRIAESNKKLLDDVRAKMDDPNFVWEL